MTAWHRDLERIQFPFLLLEQNRDEAVEFLRRRVAANLYQLSWIERYGLEARDTGRIFHFRGLRRQSDSFDALMLVISNRLALLDVADPECARILGRWYRRRDYQFGHIVSRREAVQPFWEAYAGSDKEARLNQKQKLYALELGDLENNGDMAAESNGVRRAAERDLEPVFEASARMQIEETASDPLESNPRSFRDHVFERIRSNRTFVWFDGEDLLFKADISAQSRFGAQISGVFTPPEFRNRGIATSGLSQICRTLFDEGIQRITLYVNRDNTAAIRVYGRVGFEFVTDFQTVFVSQ